MTQMSHEMKKIMNKRFNVESAIDVEEIVVIDNGTDTIKIGMSGSDYPQIIIDTISGTVEQNADNDALPPRSVFFGEHLKQVLQEKKYTIKLQQPIHEGSIDDKQMDEMAQLWRYALSELLGLELTGSKVLLVDSCANKKDYKAKLSEIFLEKLEVDSLLIMNSSSLSLLSTGSTTGFVAQLGHGLTTVVPVYEGFVLPHALQKSNISGKMITKVLEEELQKEKITISASSPLKYNEYIKQIKEKMCQAAYDYGQEMSTEDNRTEEAKSYELPDGRVVQLSKQTVFKPAEIIFNPKLVGSNAMSLVNMMKDSLSRCDSELQSQMRKNVVVCGGTSIIKGLEQRLALQFESEYESIDFVFDWQRRYSAWIGGSMLGSLSTFQSLAITKKQYNENTENKSAIIYKKCF